MSSKLSHGRIRRFCAAVLASFALFATAACGSTTSSKADASASSDGSFPVSISNMPTAPRNSRRHPNASSPSAGGVPPPPDFNPHSPCGGGRRLSSSAKPSDCARCSCLQRLVQRRADEYEPVNPHSATSRSYARAAVWRCLTGMRRSAAGKPSTMAAYPSTTSDLPGRAVFDGLGE